MALVVVLAFIIGAMTVVAMEAVGLWVLIRRLDRKVVKKETKTETAAASVSELSVSPFLYEKQGTLWVLEPDKVPKSKLEEKVTAEQKKRKEILEVTPVRKKARIKDHCLILMESDIPRVEISLRGCTVVAVSASENPSRKWAKRYPLKVESKDSALYKGSRIIYLYLETSWEKESWCKVLRLASCDDEARTTLFSNLSMEFQYYLASLSAGYPSLMKPSEGQNAELTERSVKLDNSSRVRQFLKKIAKKASKGGHDYKPSGTSIKGRAERKFGSKAHSLQDTVMPNGSAKLFTSERLPYISSDDISMASSVSTSTEQGSETASHISGLSEAETKEPKDKYIDEGSLCLNMVISRLFFDAKNNLQLQSSLHNGIQRALSNMRIPTYMGEVTCTAVDPGTLPPRILGMRVLPSDMNEVWSLEIDVEYVGDMVLDIETRLELRELEFHEEESRLNGNSDGEVTSDLLEGFEYLGKQLKLPEETIDEGHDTVETDDLRSTGNAPPQGSRWKSILHSITKQVSQVPLSLGIRVSSLCGTIRVRMKPPPSDQIWFGFTSMPDIQFNLDSFVGDHKITNARLALFLISRFKAAIRETLVLPNSENVILPWMLAEKDDWIPRKAAPFMWYKNNQDSISKHSKREVPLPPLQPGELADNVEPSHGNSTRSDVDYEISKNVGPIPKVAGESIRSTASSLRSIDESVSDQELRGPLLKDEKVQESMSRSIEPIADTMSRGEDDDTMLRRIGTRERMRGLGKKMGEKLEVKRRHFEEKGRNFVERMRAP